VPIIPDAVDSAGGLLYGRYAVRFRSDPIPGYKTAWLLWPEHNEDWPEYGEIDFPEGNLDGTISAFMHRWNGTSGSDQDAYTTDARYTSWHTAVIEWTPDYVNFILDGTLIGKSTSRIPQGSMHWVLQTETNLDGYEPDDSAQGHVQIDWVAVYVPE
jgi:beta-glucanase (GH16 family)